MNLVGIWRFTIRDAETETIKCVYTYKNLIPTVGRQAIVQHLTVGSPGYALFINFTALGSNVAAPVNGNIQLGTEVFRKATASATFAQNQAFVTAFYTATEAVGTHREAGLFINGSASPNTGILFSHVNINITKTATETLTIDYTITFV